jgi:chromatin segregation and condensation protein Rec8/ScpA/Scc1 (kleisin family)
MTSRLPGLPSSTWTTSSRCSELNLQLAGEYFVMAATLLRIKSQYLLPKNDFVETEEEFADPREELVEQLVQYSVFKKISAYFKVRNDEVPVLAAKEPSVACRGQGSAPAFRANQPAGPDGQLYFGYAPL